MPESESIESSPVSQRPQARSYRAYIEQQRNMALKREGRDGQKLWRQMVIGFVCAACVGFIMFILGSIFISEAISLKYSATIMLCVMGMVCGLIIVVGTIILGKIFISRKWRKCQGRDSHHPPAACFHTCSVIYTPSQDQLAQTGCVEPPPAYDSLVLMPLPPGQPRVILNADGSSESDGTIMVLPPKYDDIADPLPPYAEKQLQHFRQEQP